jgi:hypothetical protein
MPKLRKALMDTVTLSNIVAKSVNTYCSQLDAMADEAKGWLEGTGNAVDELYIYMAEKLKKKKIAWSSVENDPISSHADANVRSYFQGLKFLEDQALAIRNKFDTQMAKTGADEGYDALEIPLAEVAEMIRKRKKRLLLSKKYKAKLAAYEGALADLQKLVENGKAGLVKARRKMKKPPDAQRIKSIIGISPQSTLKQLKENCSGFHDRLYNEYNSLVLNLNETARDARSRIEFEKHMKMIKEMVAEADEIEKQ